MSEIFKEAYNFHQRGLLEEAKEKYLELIKLDNNNFEAHNLLGALYLQKKDFNNALLFISRAVAINTSSYSCYNNLGTTYKEINDYSNSLISYDKAIQLKFDYAEAYNNKAAVLTIINNFEAALENYNQAIKIKPDYAEAYNNRGILFIKIQKYEFAMEDFLKAVSLKKDYYEAYANLGMTNHSMGFYKEALKYFDISINLNKDFYLAHWNKSHTELITGNFDSGWKNYDYRWKKRDVPSPRYSLVEKYWKGSYLDGTLLIWGEQGIGDNIYFSSLLPEASKLAKKIILEVDQRILKLVKRYLEKINIKNFEFRSIHGKISDDYDKHIPIGSLGNFVKKNNFNSTNNKHYLLADQNVENKIKKFLLEKDLKNIGISWRTLNADEGFRNIDLDQLLPILNFSNCRFFNLQFGSFDQELLQFNTKNNIKIHSVDNIDNFEDLESLACVINSMDFVITIQNTIAHLAGALGKKTFLILAKNHRWQWGLKDTVSWYPNIKIYRQKYFHDWSDPIKRIFNDIKNDLI